MTAFKNHSLLRKLGYALAGWRYAWCAEDNFRRQVWLGVAAVLLFAVLRPPLVWWALIALCIGLMWALELVNTAVEDLVDLVSPEHRAEAGKIKDLMAGAVLLLAVATAVVGLCGVWAALRPG